MPSSNPLYLFAQLPIGCTFTFENPDNPKQFEKISDSYARSTDLEHPGVQPVSRNILVFPVYPFCLLTDTPLVSVQPIYWEEIVQPWQGADLGDFVEEELW